MLMQNNKKQLSNSDVCSCCKVELVRVDTMCSYFPCMLKKEKKK